MVIALDISALKLIKNQNDTLMGLITNTFLTLNISIKVFNSIIYKIVFDLPESSKTAWFKGLFGQISKVKVVENNFFLDFP